MKFRSGRLLFLAFFWLGFAWPGAAARAAEALVSVTVPPEKTISGERILLGETAFIEILDPAGADLAAALAGADLGPAPPPGRSLSLRRDQMKKILLESGLDIRSAAWSFPAELKVTSENAVAGEAELRAALEEYLSGQEPYRGGRFEIQSLSLAPPPVLPPGPATFRFQPQPSSNPVFISGHFIFSQNGRDVGRLRATAQVDLSVRAVAAAKALPRGRILTEEDLSLVLAPFSQAKGALAEPDLAVGAALKTPLAAGELIRERSLGKKALVRRGDPVTLVARKGGLSVETLGEAQEDGGEGDVVAVLNASSKKKVRGRVTGPGRVEALF